MRTAAIALLGLLAVLASCDKPASSATGMTSAPVTIDPATGRAIAFWLDYRQTQPDAPMRRVPVVTEQPVAILIDWPQSNESQSSQSPRMCWLFDSRTGRVWRSPDFDAFLSYLDQLSVPPQGVIELIDKCTMSFSAGMPDTARKNLADHLARRGMSLNGPGENSRCTCEAEIVWPMD